MIEMDEKGKGKLIKQESEEEEIKTLFLGIMEGYNDSAVPPLSYFSPSVNENGSSVRKTEKSEESRFRNLLNERKRKDRMSDSFSLLQSMVPNLFKTIKRPKEAILSETIWYIKFLEEEVQRLEDLKKPQFDEPKLSKFVLSKCTNDQNLSVKVEVSNGATFFATQLPFKRGLVPEIVKVLEKYKAEVLEARFCVNEQRLLTFTASIILGTDDGGNTIEKIKDEILVL